jgi:hypothetical protein
MNRRQFLTATSSIATLGALSSSASAQDGDNQTATSTTTEPETDTVVREIDENTRVTDWSYQDGAFTVTLESDTVSTVTLSEQIGADREGSGRFGIRQVRVTNSNPVETTIPAQKVDNKAVITLVTSASINQGYGIYLQAGNGFNLFDGPATWSLAGIGAFGTFAGTAWGTKRYRESKLEEQEKRQVEEVK